MSAFSNCCYGVIPGAFPFYNPFFAALTLPTARLSTTISSTLSWTSSSRSSVIGFADAFLLSTSLKCYVHLAFTSLLLMMRVSFLPRTVVLYLDLSFHNIIVSSYSVLCVGSLQLLLPICNVLHPLSFIHFYTLLNFSVLFCIPRP